jgi:hypothetical protein
MNNVQEMALMVKNGEIGEEEFIIGCKKIIEDASYKWYQKVGLMDGREIQEKRQLCSIWCWEALRNYNPEKGKFTTLYYAHTQNMIKNLCRRSTNDNEKANNYTNCFSYEFSICGESENSSEEGSAFIKHQCNEEDGFERVEIEMMLKHNGFDDITMGIVKYKMESPEMPDAEIARLLGYSRAYISLLWRKVKPFLASQLCTADNF